MIELLIFAALALVAVIITFGYQMHQSEKAVEALYREFTQERLQWHEERRFLIDRTIARHTGEVVALDREQTRRTENHVSEDRPPRPLLEGLT